MTVDSDGVSMNSRPNAPAPDAAGTAFLSPSEERRSGLDHVPGDLGPAPGVGAGEEIPRRTRQEGPDVPPAVRALPRR